MIRARLRNHILCKKILVRINPHKPREVFVSSFGCFTIIIIISHNLLQHDCELVKISENNVSEKKMRLCFMKFITV